MLLTSCEDILGHWERPAAVELTSILVTDVTLNKSESFITPGETETLTATIAPGDATAQTVNWSSDNEAVATVANGVVTALAAGTATITASANDGSGVNATCVVKVFRTIDLSTLTADYEAQDCDMLTGTLGGIYKITIADDATIALKDAVINGTHVDNSYKWAGLTPQGNATILLTGSNTVKGFHYNYPGIFAAVDKTLTIKGEGSLDASSNGWAPAIGAGYEIACGNIVILGGNITAAGKGTSAAIGGCYKANCGDITISGGTITATNAGYSYSACIGGSCDASCGDITITGGTVTATSGTYGAGIGGGCGYYISASCGKITITGGTVTATGGSYGAGIGSSIGYYETTSCGDISITGGTVIATGGSYGAGIGSGDSYGAYSVCDNISITGGTITATGGIYGAGIGNGYYSKCGNITIESTVTKVIATKGTDSPNSIGNGINGTCGTVTIGGTEGAITDSPYTYEP